MTSPNHLASYDERTIRTALLAGLADISSNTTIYSYDQIAWQIARGIFSPHDSPRIKSQWVLKFKTPASDTVDDPDTQKILSVTWDLVTQGVFYPRLRVINSVPPRIDYHYGLTERGRRLLATAEAHPLHPGFITRLERNAPNINKDILSNFEDATVCLGHGLLRASVVLIGLAAEASIRVCHGAFVSMNMLQSPPLNAKQTLIQITDATRIWSNAAQPPISNDAKHRLQFALTSLESLRQERNGAAHPGAVALDPTEVESLITLASLQIPILWQLPIKLATQENSFDPKLYA